MSYNNDSGTYNEANSDSEGGAGGEEGSMIGENLRSDIDLQQHLSRKMFAKVQEALIDIDVHASPSQLAQTIGANVWRLATHLTKNFKANIGTRNRNLATEDQLEGNLNRCIPLHLEVTMVKNSFPYFMGIKIPGMMDKNLHKNGACVYRVPPDTATMMVGEAVFEPVNTVNKYNYETYKRCTLEDLAKDVEFVKGEAGKHDAHALITVRSLAYQTLMDSLNDNCWQEEYEHFDIEAVENPGRSAKVQVTQKMGKQIVAILKPQVEEAAAGFINLEDFNVESVRADGYGTFDTPKGLHGELIGKGIASGSKLNIDRMQKACCFLVKARFHYQLF